MPISIRIVDDKFVVVNCEGKVGLVDFTEANEYIYSELDPSLSRFQIVNFTDVAEIDASAEDVRKVAGQDKAAAETLGLVAIAIVAPKDLAFGISRMWEAYSDAPGVKASVFKDYGSAEEWILSMRAGKS
ncbi:MAG: hypothetical protein SWE60_06870 [Thermodesulfobacteriota bacterium]|nr:hypothetical protein [Thermodesulfobacteriota bacterium]